MEIRIKDYSKFRDNKTGELVFDEAEYNEFVTYIQRKQGESEERRKPEEPPIHCFDDGTVEADGVPLDLTPKQRIILQMLENGKCERGRMMDEVFGARKIQTLKNPDGAMCTQISRLNAKLESYRIFIETGWIFYFLKRF